MHLTSELQTPISSCLRTKTSSVGMHFLSKNVSNILVLKLFGFAILFFVFLYFSMGETLHIAYKRYKIKRKFTFLGVNTKNISSRELKTSKISLVLRTRENSNVFNKLDKLYLVFTVSVRSRSRNVFFFT